MTKLARLLRRRLGREDGYTLMELLLVISIFGTVTGALTALFVSATNAEVDSNRRFQSQQEARLGLAAMRSDVHCSTAATLSGSSSVTLTLPSQCPGTPTVTWCAVGSGTRFALYRSLTSPCDATDRLYADYMTSNALFTLLTPSQSLTKLRVYLNVNATPSKVTTVYRLQDELTLRNSLRNP